ncbi:hypothetical protein DPMN_059540 [Dreissena polymorpha]|uniref:Uncharacterized protein n=1 Tax=Dreissena polymorpha TaxID=45954 RepID=A0A9D4HHC1_DREPO|nr:hypothetical protein DPMN_059540 [Dreissena polymorpha]
METNTLLRKTLKEDFNECTVELADFDSGCEYLFRVRGVYGDDEGPYSGGHIGRCASDNKSSPCHIITNIIGTNIVTKILEDRKINVTSRVLTMLYYSNIRKNAPPPGSHVFQPIVTILKLIQDIIETYILAKFYEDWNINVASTELTRQMLTAHDGHKAITKAHHEHVV